MKINFREIINKVDEKGLEVIKFVLFLLKEFKIMYKEKQNVGIGFVLFGFVYSIIINVIYNSVASIITIVFIISGIYIIGKSRIGVEKNKTSKFIRECIIEVKAETNVPFGSIVHFIKKEK